MRYSPIHSTLSPAVPGRPRARDLNPAVSTPRSRPKMRHWKKGRSTCSLADFIMNRKGTSRLESVLTDVLGQSVTLEAAVPEYLAQFDTYRGNSSE